MLVEYELLKLSRAASCSTASVIRPRSPIVQPQNSFTPPRLTQSDPAGITRQTLPKVCTPLGMRAFSSDVASEPITSTTWAAPRSVFASSSVSASVAAMPTLRVAMTTGIDDCGERRYPASVAAWAAVSAMNTPAPFRGRSSWMGAPAGTVEGRSFRSCRRPSAPFGRSWPCLCLCRFRWFRPLWFPCLRPLFRRASFRRLPSRRPPLRRLPRSRFRREWGVPSTTVRSPAYGQRMTRSPERHMPMPSSPRAAAARARPCAAARGPRPARSHRASSSASPSDGSARSGTGPTAIRRRTGTCGPRRRTPILYGPGRRSA